MFDERPDGVNAPALPSGGLPDELSPAWQDGPDPGPVTLDEDAYLAAASAPAGLCRRLRAMPDDELLEVLNAGPAFEPSAADADLLSACASELARRIDYMGRTGRVAFHAARVACHIDMPVIRLPRAPC